MVKRNALRFIPISAMLFILLLLLGCQPKNTPLRVALLEWPPYELVFWASENGWITDEHATLLEYKTPAEVTRAFATESVDIIAVTSDFALTVSELVPETRIFLVINTSNGGDTVLSRTAIKGADELRGKSIGVESGPLGTYMLTRLMDSFGLKKGDLEVVYEDIPGQIDLWEQGNVDLLITYEPIRSKLTLKGAIEVFSTRDIPNEIIDVFLVRESVLETQKENIEVFVRSWFKAVDDLYANDPALYQFIGRRESLPDTAVRYMFDLVHVPNLEENKNFLSGNNEQMLNGLSKHESIMLQEGLMEKPVDKTGLLTNAALTF